MYESRLKSEAADALFKAILALQNEEECYRFFEDVCTISEVGSIAQRWEVARLLFEGLTYSAIAERTGASTATVSRVGKCLNYGANGYRLVLDRLADK
ncbi:MAG: YerC/YecD family TrpR-related protein [Clostridia bacterium]|nr:YerC/YecD family TrpR-related protein [Clostridia bacterium]